MAVAWIMSDRQSSGGAVPQVDTSDAAPDPARAAERIEADLDIMVSDRALLEQALTHRSYAFEAGGLPHNERLEFLGDAVLGVIITDLIYRMLPDASEGRLAKIRAAAVNTHSLAEVARGLGVGAAVRLGRGEEQSGGRNKDSILADTMEALLGAVYLDQGIGAVVPIVRRLFDDLLCDIVTRRESLDYKTSLQELGAAVLSQVPTYELSEEGPDHEKRFTAAVALAGEVLGYGYGRSKKEAEQGAAQQAYVTLQRRLATVPRADESQE